MARLFSSSFPRLAALLLLSLSLTLLDAPASRAQIGAPPMGALGDQQLEISGVPFMRYARPGENTVQVLVVGAVGTPGIYILGESVQLDELLALSRGLGIGGTRTTETVQSVTVQLLRQQGGRRTVIYEASIDDMLREPQAYPSLQDDDIFRVETVTSRRFTWRDGLQIVTGIASLVSLGLRIERLLN